MRISSSPKFIAAAMLALLFTTQPITSASAETDEHTATASDNASENENNIVFEEPVNIVENTPPPVCAADDASCLILEQDAPYTLEEFGRLDIVTILEDSRCPVDVFCFWEGQVRIELKRAVEGQAEKFELGLGGGLDASWTDGRTGKTLLLEEVWPQPNLSNPVDKPYQLKVRVLLADSDVPDAENESSELQRSPSETH